MTTETMNNSEMGTEEAMKWGQWEYRCGYVRTRKLVRIIINGANKHYEFFNGLADIVRAARIKTSKVVHCNPCGSDTEVSGGEAAIKEFLSHYEPMLKEARVVKVAEIMASVNTNAK